MKSSGKNISLASYDEIFSTEESRADAQRKKIVEIPLTELFPFRDHPFKVVDDDRMRETAESVREYGVLVPAIARPLDGGGYELVAGHRRKRACELAGLETMPVIVRDLDDDAAVIIMVDSNLQRENILPSERAKAYQMKLEAIKHQGKKLEATSPQVGEKSGWAVSQVAEEAGQSRSQVQRFVRLTNLVPDLMDMVDERKVAMNPAYELSFLKPEEQVQLVETMETCQSTPSLSQAQRLKKFSQEGKLSGDVMEAIMSEEKKPPQNREVFDIHRLRKCFPEPITQERMGSEVLQIVQCFQGLRRFFPKSYTTEQIGQAMTKFMELRQKKLQQQKTVAR